MLITILAFVSVQALAWDGIASEIRDNRQTVTTAGTAVQLSTSQIRAKRIIIQSESDNTGLIAVGGSTVVAAAGSQQGIVLVNAGDSVTLINNDLSEVYIDSSVNGEGVTYAYFI